MLTRVAVTAVVLATAFGAVRAQERQSAPARNMVLTPQDYIDIQQLVARYAY